MSTTVASTYTKEYAQLQSQKLQLEACIANCYIAGETISSLTVTSVTGGVTTKTPVITSTQRTALKTLLEAELTAVNDRIDDIDTIFEDIT
jgi:hypothetical protein